MEDWYSNDDTGVSVNTEEPEILTSGKIFGSRGRGFSRAIKSEPKIGKKNFESELEDNLYDSGNDNDGFTYKTEKERNRINDFHSNNVKGAKNNVKVKKIKSVYIPEEPTDNEAEIYGHTISSGINFSKYDDIEVSVSGENPPNPIHSFHNAGLINYMVEIIKKCNYNKPTPVQKYSIPIIMDGRDMMACAQTGSGKTAAFLIPIINCLLENKQDIDVSGPCKPQALIISPTRELAIQIFNEARKFSHRTSLKVAISYGGTSIFHQMKNLLNGCNILVATVGRFLDFLNRKKIDLSNLKFLVLDEADRMLDLGFLPQVETIMTHETIVSSHGRQTLMFSATFPEEIQQLAGKFLNQYLFVAVGIVGGACSDVEQKIFSVTKFEKRNKLVELLKESEKKKCLVFVEQKRTTDFIATFLCEKNFPATSIHGDREQKEREEALKDFKSGRMDVLVATSVAARGLDIKNVAHVINFDLPKTIDEYVHRIGRTGRVGNRGLATSFFDPTQDIALANDLMKILKQAGQTVPDFLKNAASGGESDGNFYGSSKFGGRDCRNQEFQKDAFISAQEASYEKEVW